MSIGLLGRKLGMTRIFNDDGNSVPVTVVEIEANKITQIKTKESDGYDAVQITTGVRRVSRVSKPMAGHFAKAKVEAGRKSIEFRLTDGVNELEVGGELPITTFAIGQKIDITGISRGFGFQGGIKRWNFRGQDNTHGNSISHRANGSIGQCQTPGRVFKGKKMSGHMGDRQVTTQNLVVVRVDSEKNIILIKGAVPGAKGGDVIIRHSIKG